MDKILRRVRMAEGMVARRAERKKAVNKRIQARKTNQRQSEGFNEAISQRKAAIEARNEDWMLGPLAPRRELDASHPITRNYYGSISPTRTLLENVVSEEEKKARTAWCGSPKFLCVAPGDRVVILEGHYKDIIGTIEKLNTKNMTVEIKSEKLKVSTTTTTTNDVAFVIVVSCVMRCRVTVIVEYKYSPHTCVLPSSRQTRPYPNMSWTKSPSPSSPLPPACLSRRCVWCTRSRTPRRASSGT